MTRIVRGRRVIVAHNIRYYYYFLTRSHFQIGTGATRHKPKKLNENNRNTRTSYLKEHAKLKTIITNVASCCVVQKTKIMYLTRF